MEKKMKNLVLGLVFVLIAFALIAIAVIAVNHPSSGTMLTSII
jgi:hypothetical protein